MTTPDGTAESAGSAGSTVRRPEDEAGRGIVWVVHLAMISAVPLYAGVLWLLSPAPAPGGAETSRDLPWILLAVGAGEYGAASFLGARLLRAARGRSNAGERVRRFFLVRFAAAEAIALFGLVLGLRGVPRSQSLVLFAASVAALALAAPTRPAWARAFALTRAG